MPKAPAREVEKTLSEYSGLTGTKMSSYQVKNQKNFFDD